MQQFNFKFEVICASAQSPDLTKAEEMINLAMQDLVYDDEFIAALGERESVTIRVVPILDKLANDNG